MPQNGMQLIEVVRLVLTGTPLREDVDWRTVVKLAKQHNLMGFVYHASREREDLTPEQHKKLASMYELSVAQQLQQNVAANAIYIALKEAGIRYMPLKGAWFRPLYPSQDLRFSCDIDFYFDISRAKEVYRLLVAQGFEKKREDVHNHVYTRGILTVEPHFAIADGDKEVAYFGDVWARGKSEDGIAFTLGDEDAYLYHLLHTYKHMKQGGAGVRSVIDTWVWNQNKPHMDRAYLEAECQKLGISKFVSALERLSHVWFDGLEADEEMQVLGDYILTGGAYGTAAQKAQMEHVQGGGKKELRRARRKYLLSRLFPTYGSLCLRYPVLKKWAILTPIFWLIRLFATLFTPKRAVIEADLQVAQSIGEETAQTVTRIQQIIG